MPLSPDFPSHACAIYIGEKGELRLGLPPSEGHATASSVALRADQNGLSTLIQILSRRLQEANARAKVGTVAVPTQALAEALQRGQNVAKLEDHKRKRAEAERLKSLPVEDFIAEIGDLL